MKPYPLAPLNHFTTPCCSSDIVWNVFLFVFAGSRRVSKYKKIHLCIRTYVRRALKYTILDSLLVLSLYVDAVPKLVGDFLTPRCGGISPPNRAFKPPYVAAQQKSTKNGTVTFGPNRPSIAVSLVVPLAMVIQKPSAVV